MKLKLTILFLSFCVNAFSQNDVLFNYNYPLEWQYDCNAMLVIDSCYYIAGDIARVTEECEFALFGFHITKINSTGDVDTTVIYDKCEQVTYMGWKGSSTVIGDTLITFGMSYDENQNHKMFVLQSTQGFDTIRVNYYFEDTLTKRSFSCCATNDNNLILCGQVDSTRDENTGIPEITFSKAYLLKTSLAGETIWSKDYYFGDIYDGCYSLFKYVIPTYDNGFIATGRTSDFGNSKNLVLKVDSLGNQEWVKFYGNSMYDNPTFTDIIETSDSCYIVCGAYTYGEAYGGLYPYDGWLIKFDNEGNTVWDKKYRDYTVENTDWRDTIYNVFNGITELENGRIAAIATSKNGTIYGRKPKLYILNELGDTISTKIYENADYWYNATSIVNTTDGGFAIAGNGEFVEWNNETESWETSQRIFLIKTDSLGNDTIVNTVSPAVSKPIDKFELVCFPNPARNEFFIDLAEDAQNDVLEIYSTNGSIVHEQRVEYGNNTVNICNLKTGMYLVKIKGKNLYGKIIVE